MISEIETLLAAREFHALRRKIAELPVSLLADIVSELPSPDDVIFFRLLPRHTAADVFEYAPPEKQQALIQALASHQRRLAELLNDLAPDDRTALFEELPGPIVQRLMNLLAPEEKTIAATLLGYPEESVGRLMTPDYVAIRGEWTIADALRHIRCYGRDSETLNIIYVVDEKWRLVDDLRIREVLLASPEARIADLIDGHCDALLTTDDQERAVRCFAETDRVALPVVDSSGILVGIVTVDDVLDVAEEEVTEDIQKIGGLEVLHEPYMDTPLFTLVKKRARWLTALFLGEMLTATAMGYFEAEIARAVVLALFVPLIISSGGNSGSQAATLIIRAMAVGEITLADWWRVMRREIFSGLSLGAVLGVIGFVRVAVWQELFGIYGEHWPFIALTVGLSLIGVVLWGTLSGSMLPFFIRSLGGDPATSSAPFVATLVDVTGLVIYFSVAALLLSGRLL